MRLAILKHIVSFAQDVEYPLILILVALTIVGGVGALRTGLNGLFDNPAGQVNSAKVPAL